MPLFTEAKQDSEEPIILEKTLQKFLIFNSKKQSGTNPNPTTAKNTNILQLGPFQAELKRKRVKNLTLRVLSPDGPLKLSAPLSMPVDFIERFILSKLSWIQKQQERLRRLRIHQNEKSEPTYENGEGHPLWGRNYPLLLGEPRRGKKIFLHEGQIHFPLPADTSIEKKIKLMETWYKEELTNLVPELAAKWQPQMGVSAQKFVFRSMKTRWGTCNPRSGTIRLNTELAKKDPSLLEYVLVHELVHLLEISHNTRFKAFMDKFLPNWRELKKRLNSGNLSFDE